MGGKFTANIYIGYKDGDKLHIGVLQLKGAAYSKWNEFFSKNKEAVQKGAVQVKAHEDGKKGAVKFKTPVFEVIEIAEDTNKEAIELDKQLQAFFAERIKPVATPAQQSAPAPQAAAPAAAPPYQEQQPPAPTEEDFAAMSGDDDIDGLPF